VTQAREGSQGFTGGLAHRSVVLFANFFLIILAYYQIKAASRSLLIEHWGADILAYVWIASAVVLTAFIAGYHRLVERHQRLHVVLASCATFIVLLLAFRAALGIHGPLASLAFYVFVDILSVILVEQFWSLASTVTRTDEGRRSYWFVGTGGLVGGVAGGALGAALLRYTPMGTADLLLSCALLLAAVFALNLAMGRMGLYREVRYAAGPVSHRGGWKALVGSRYLLLIAAALLCAQVVQPLVEYQFLKTVEATYTVLDERTTFISAFFGALGFVSIGVNLLFTPIIHRYLGIFAGMLAQPIVLAGFSFGFMLQPTLLMASAMKIGDRGLSYSINRASKELLYIPVDPVLTYQAKAWIDMLGYRLFKVVGSVLILLATQWLPVQLDVGGIGWLTFAVCLLWIAVIARLAREYHSFAPRAVPVPA
jgi:ATP:ADP antiporter, AAA family